jgi:hypothetical protein
MLTNPINAKMIIRNNLRNKDLGGRADLLFFLRRRMAGFGSKIVKNELSKMAYFK